RPLCLSAVRRGSAYLHRRHVRNSRGNDCHCDDHASFHASTFSGPCGLAGAKGDIAAQGRSADDGAKATTTILTRANRRMTNQAGKDTAMMERCIRLSAIAAQRGEFPFAKLISMGSPKARMSRGTRIWWRFRKLKRS